MTWQIPLGVPFDLTTHHGEFHNCRLVGVSGGIVAVDRDCFGPLGRVTRLRTQIALDSIVAVHAFPSVERETTQPAEHPADASIPTQG